MQEFYDTRIPPYTILSHCWGGSELSYLDFCEAQSRQDSVGEKIEECCRIAREQNIEWAWVDTCCIDKRSSAELSEAINSMFLWYSKANVCYAFISDFDVSGTGQAFSECRWFTRGWTLQELLAPKSLIFYDRKYRVIGVRDDLIDQVSMATGIDTKFLAGQDAFRTASVAQKMSWAANRQTSRTEDLAYGLLGLFDVNMPLLYGEGADRAFLRLQEQVFLQSADESIFAWNSELHTQPRGLLANSPREFQDGRYIYQLPGYRKRKRFRLAGRGFKLSIEQPYGSGFQHIKALFTSSEETVVSLRCVYRGDGDREKDSKRVCLQLRVNPDQQRFFQRTRTSDLILEQRKISLIDTCLATLSGGPFFFKAYVDHEYKAIEHFTLELLERKDITQLTFTATGKFSLFVFSSIRNLLLTENGTDRHGNLNLFWAMAVIVTEWFWVWRLPLELYLPLLYQAQAGWTSSEDEGGTLEPWMIITSVFLLLAQDVSNSERVLTS